MFRYLGNLRAKLEGNWLGAHLGNTRGSPLLDRTGDFVPAADKQRTQFDHWIDVTFPEQWKNCNVFRHRSAFVLISSILAPVYSGLVWGDTCAHRGGRDAPTTGIIPQLDELV